MFCVQRHLGTAITSLGVNVGIISKTYCVQIQEPVRGKCAYSRNVHTHTRMQTCGKASVTATDHVLSRNTSHSKLRYRGRGVRCQRRALLGLSSLSAHDLQPILARRGAHGGGRQAVQPAPLHSLCSHPHPTCTNTSRVCTLT